MKLKKEDIFEFAINDNTKSYGQMVNTLNKPQ